ncbi:hypothetical protein WKI23_07585 [Streptococcus pneumoniae]|uniref:hypothetical protein n=1 Tax=Streptococcus pseudopneumoniae TaxID=257758 RepID=UPI0031288508
MAREGIYIGNKEITQRYVGTRLVWEKRIRVLELFSKFVIASPSYGENVMNIYDYRFGFSNYSIDEVRFIGKTESNVIPVTLERGYSNNHIKARFRTTEDFEKAKSLFNSSNGETYMSFYSTWR